MSDSDKALSRPETRESRPGRTGRLSGCQLGSGGKVHTTTDDGAPARGDAAIISLDNFRRARERKAIQDAAKKNRRPTLSEIMDGWPFGGGSAA